MSLYTLTSFQSRLKLLPKSLIRLLSTTALPDRVPFHFTPPTTSEPTTPWSSSMLHWSEKPRNCLIIRKRDQKTEDALIRVSSWLKSVYPDTNVIVEPNDKASLKDKLPFIYSLENPDDSCSAKEYSRVVDLVIALGGDGTMLHASSLFQEQVQPPPFVSFAMGSLGFLMPFQLETYQSTISRVMEGNVSVLHRSRLSVSHYDSTDNRIEMYNQKRYHCINEVLLHRGRQPHMVGLDCLVNNGLISSGSVADGLLISTPTGSTAYSLSAGGPKIHPSVQSILVTPICPRSLSYKPVVLPDYVDIVLKVAETSRAVAEISIDGKEIGTLQKGECIKIQKSKYALPCINNENDTVDWVKGLAKIRRY
ncbi:ATP-NAD kinase-like domain-containing protein [Paraphysoderma sedebokerense]|nr:ATP-NAD kinase-like domain-containing protein [Paraphysoderma sedebokerense]